MLSISAYLGILIPTYLVIPILLGIVLTLIPTRRLVDLTKMVFGVEIISEEDDDLIIINFHGTRVNMENWSEQGKMISALTMTFYMVFVVFFSGCVISTDTFIGNQVCPSKPKDCFIYDSVWSMSPSQSFVCTPGEPVIPINSSAYRAACFGYILGDQKTIDILNQLGICTGILTLSANVLWIFCCMASRWWGLIIHGILVIGGVVTISVFQFAHVPYEILTLVLISLCIIQILIAIYIVVGNETEQIYPVESPAIEPNHTQISTTNQNFE